MFLSSRRLAREDGFFLSWRVCLPVRASRAWREAARSLDVSPARGGLAVRAAEAPPAARVPGLPGVLPVACLADWPPAGLFAAEPAEPVELVLL